MLSYLSYASLRCINQYLYCIFCSLAVIELALDPQAEFFLHLWLAYHNLWLLFG